MCAVLWKRVPNMESKEGKQAEQCAFVQLDFEHTRISGEERSVQKEEYMHVGFQRGQAAREAMSENLKHMHATLYLMRPRIEGQYRFCWTDVEW